RRDSALCLSSGATTRVRPYITGLISKNSLMSRPESFLAQKRLYDKGAGCTPRKENFPAVEDDRSLLVRIQRHDQKALVEVYDQYFDQIYRYLNYRLSEPEVAADLTGDVFLALVNALKAGKPPRTSLSGWLYAVARNLAADYIKTKTRTVALIEDLAADELSLTDQVHLSQLGPMLREAILQLTEEQQHVITLRFGQGLSLAETAHLLDKSIGAIKGLQHRALASLARFIPEGVENDG
ncbi:MAG: sigma-70 family RNA polymerase sigma factor, partial [Anaerolineae bacterium]|nr:sigma-70 family RNA polymerase sigma factor [Anaerolineae bacterium]